MVVRSLRCLKTSQTTVATHVFHLRVSPVSTNPFKKHSRTLLTCVAGGSEEKHHYGNLCCFRPHESSKVFKRDSPALISVVLDTSTQTCSRLPKYRTRYPLRNRRWFKNPRIGQGREETTLIYGGINIDSRTTWVRLFAWTS